MSSFPFSFLFSVNYTFSFSSFLTPPTPHHHIPYFGLIFPSFLFSLLLISFLSPFLLLHFFPVPCFTEESKTHVCVCGAGVKKTLKEVCLGKAPSANNPDIPTKCTLKKRKKKGRKQITDNSMDHQNVQAIFSFFFFFFFLPDVDFFLWV